MKNPEIAPNNVSDDGYVHGYMTKDGSFLGYNPVMTLIPDLVPARFHVASGVVEPTGHSRSIPRGEALITDAGFGGSEQVVGGHGMVEDKGEGFAPSKVTPVTLPEGPSISPELAAKILERTTKSAASKG